MHSEYRYTQRMALHLDQITGPLPSNRVGDVIYDRILDAIHYGELRPGNG